MSLEDLLGVCLTYRTQSVNMQYKSIDWFLYHGRIVFKGVKQVNNERVYPLLSSAFLLELLLKLYQMSPLTQETCGDT